MQPLNYARDYRQQYDRRNFETILVEYRRARVLQSMRAHPHARVLEIGCGVDPLFGHCDDFEQFTVVESVGEFAAAARERADGRVAVIEGYFERVGELLESRRPYDFVVCSSLLHEVPDPDVLAASIRGVCEPRTVVHFNVPNVRSFHRLLAVEMGVIPSVFEKSGMERTFGRHAQFDLQRLVGLLRRHGFRELEAGTYFLKPFTHRQMDWLLASGEFDPAILDGLSRMVKHLPEMGCELYVDAIPV